MAAALLAALFAMGVFSATGVGAQEVNCVPDADANPAVECAELASPPTITGRVGYTLDPTFDNDVLTYSTTVPKNEQLYVTIAAAGEAGATATILPVDVNDDGDATTTDDEGHQIDISTVPEKITVRVMDDGEDATVVGGARTYTFNLNYDTEDVSDSATAGSAAKIRISGVYTAAVGGEISVDMTGFGLPSTIDVDDVFVQSGATGATIGEFSDIVVKGDKIVFTLKDADTSSDANNALAATATDPAIITIRSRAGVTNPAKAGLYPITVTDETGTGIDAVNVVKVESSVSLDPEKGSSGADVTVTGKGFVTGSATVYIDKTPDDPDTTDVDEESYTPNMEYDDGVDVVIASGATITDGSFTATIPGISKPDDVDKVTIGAFDGGNNFAEKMAEYTFSSGLSVSPESISWGQTLTLTMTDNSQMPEEVRFGGNNDYKAPVQSGATTSTAKVNVPPGVPVGNQNVEVISASGVVSGLSTTVEIVPLTLSITPSDPVPGEQVTIRGSGFENSRQITGITFGSLNEVALSNPNSTSTSSGRVSFTYQVPLDIGNGQKTVTLDVGDRIGEGSITVAKPSITVSPEESLIGSTITITGSAFASNGRVEVFYGEDIEAVGVADSNGDVSIDVMVPSTAGIGASNTVEVSARNEPSIKGSATHRTPGAMITVSDEAQAGGMITISGSNFQSFSILSEVLVGGQNVLPSPAPETDRKGTFSFQVRVPLLGVGSHTVSVKDGDDNSATETFSVVLEPTVVVTDPAEVFADLIAAGTLDRVWYLDAEIQLSDPSNAWTFYDTNPEFAEFNNLAAIQSGKIYVLIMNAAGEFNGQPLFPGTNFVSIP